MTLMQARRHVTLIVFLASLAGMVAIGYATWSYCIDSKDYPIAKMDGCGTIDLGELRPGQMGTAELVLANKGYVPLSFSLVTSCGCQMANPRTGEVAPGESQIIKVGMRLESWGNSKNASVSCRTNDTQHPEFIKTLVARSSFPVMVSPSELDFGNVIERSMKTIVFDVCDKNLRRLPDQSVVVESSHLTLVALSDGKYSLTLKSDAKIGELDTVLQIKIPDTNEWIQWPVKCRIDPNISTFPTRLTFAGTTPERIVTIWRGDRSTIADVSLQTHTDHFSIRKLEQTRDKVKVRVSVVKGFDIETSGTLELLLDKGDKIAIPFNWGESVSLR